MYLPDNLSNNVHLMKISPFRFASVETTEELLKSQRQMRLRCSRNDRGNFSSRNGRRDFATAKRQMRFRCSRNDRENIQSNNKEQTFRSAKANPG